MPRDLTNTSLPAGIEMHFASARVEYDAFDELPHAVRAALAEGAYDMSSQATLGLVTTDGAAAAIKEIEASNAAFAHAPEWHPVVVKRGPRCRR